MRFDTDTLKNRYQTCRSYLEKDVRHCRDRLKRNLKMCPVIMNHPDVTA